MPTPSPVMKWPAIFREEGPPTDPSILLSGDAEVGGVAFRVSAMRMRTGLRVPDYRDDVSASAYRAAMDSTLDDVEDLVDSIDPELVIIDGAEYLLWMVPAARD